MKGREAKELLKQIYVDLFEGRIDISMARARMQTYVAPVDKVHFSDTDEEELLQEAYYWLYLAEHEPPPFQTTMDELRYMLECLTGKRTYSKSDFSKYLRELREKSGR